MANSAQILDKLVRNLTMRGVTAARGDTNVTVTKTGGHVLTVTYVAKQLQSPMGGVDPTVSPFLGIGIASPGSLMVKGYAGENTIGAIVSTTEALALMQELAGFNNDIIVQAGDSTTQLARIAGDADRLGMGQ